MKVYESEGTFNCEAQTFNLKVQTTDINPDAFYISAFYNICNKERFAIVGILQTKDGNTKDFSKYPPDSTLNIEKGDFSWSTDVIFTRNREKIVSLPNGDDIAAGRFIGQPLTVFYDLKKIGIWQTSEKDLAASFGDKVGEIKIEDAILALSHP